MSEKDKPDIDKRNEESLGQLSSSISNAWQYNSAHFINSSIEQVPNVSPMDIHRDLVDPACSLSSMVESFGPAIWEHPVSSATPLSFNEMNVHIGSSTSDPLMMLKGNQFSPSASGMIPPSLSRFPADSGFIERAARFSNFSRGHFPDMPNPFDLHQSENPCHQSETMIQAHPEVLTGNAMKLPDSRQTQKGRAISLAPQGGLFEGSPSRRESAERPSDEAETVRISGNNSEEAQPSGRGTQEDGGAPLKGLGPRKRKRTYHDVEPEQDNGVSQLSKNAAKNNTESQQKGEQSLSPASNKSNRKHSKEVSQASVPPKGEYIHVRAQRGQATNSHSLAERIRREKISERMKFLQDLVPGCNKVTGKAVMLDEIINYVQSLQRQVEFLSMKLAMVNPSLDHNIDQLLAKSHMLAAAGPSSGRISLDMPMVHPPLHPNQPSILQPGLPSFGNSSDALRRTVSPQLEDTSSKEPIRKITNMWEDELHNIVQTGLNAIAPFKNQGPNSHS